MGHIALLKRLRLSDHLIRRNPLYYPRARRLLAKFARLQRVAQNEWRMRALRGLLAAAGHSAYGRARGAPPVLADWPILEKESLRDEPEAFLAPGSWVTVAAATSGTSGVPVNLKRSLASIAYEQALLDSLLEGMGLVPGRCRAAVLRGDDIKSPADRSPPYWRVANAGRRLIFSSNHLDVHTVGDFVGALRAYAPEAIFAYPTVLASLCALMLARGDALSVPVTVCSSEVLTRELARLAANMLGTRVLDYYGQAERVGFAFGDPERGYRFEPTYSINELRLAESAGDADVYELVGTGLWNRAMPLVRYRTEDRFLLEKGSAPAEVADGLAPFYGIIGRSGDFLISPSGARLMGIDHIPRSVPHLVRAQFIQESPEAVTLLVIPAPGFDESSRRLLLTHASLKLPPSMRVSIEITSELVRNSSGKAPLVVRRFGQAEELPRRVVPS
jgi:phenylacetate-CoA ligase